MIKAQKYSLNKLLWRSCKC